MPAEPKGRILMSGSEMQGSFVSLLRIIDLGNPYIKYANKLPSETWINLQESPKLHSPFRYFLQYGGSLFLGPLVRGFGGPSSQEREAAEGGVTASTRFTVI